MRKNPAHEISNNGKALLDSSLFVPVVVNCSFACELFLKSMLSQDIRGHKLDELFFSLDNNLQERIRNITINEMKKISPVYSDDNFQNDLTENNNIFAEWRYFHEGDSLAANLEFISRFMKVIFLVANKERQK